jgi:hypothetical protein
MVPIFLSKQRQCFRAILCQTFPLSKCREYILNITCQWLAVWWDIPAIFVSEELCEFYMFNVINRFLDYELKNCKLLFCTLEAVSPRVERSSVANLCKCKDHMRALGSALWWVPFCHILASLGLSAVISTLQKEYML